MDLLEIGVEEDVIAEELEAIRAVDVGLLEFLLGLLVYREHALDNYVVDLGPH